MFDAIFDISCSGYSAPFKGSWPSDFDVSFEQAKHAIVLDSCDPLSSQLGPKDLSFETRVLAHIIGTSLLPRASSLCVLSQRDTLLTYCLLTNRKIMLSSFILSYMVDSALNPSVLPYGLLILKILEASNIYLTGFSGVSVKQCYNSKAFVSMGYVNVEDS